MAALLGCAATIYVPADMAQPRIDAIAGEGAAVTVVDGTYDDAVARAAETPTRATWSSRTPPGPATRTCRAGSSRATRRSSGRSTTNWPRSARRARRGRWRRSASARWRRRVGHYRQPDGPRPRIVGVEPTTRLRHARSLHAGRLIEVPGPHDSIMAGLNCGIPSPLAYPVVSAGTDLFVAIDDERAREAMRRWRPAASSPARRARRGWRPAGAAARAQRRTPTRLSEHHAAHQRAAHHHRRRD